MCKLRFLYSFFPIENLAVYTFQDNHIGSTLRKQVNPMSIFCTRLRSARLKNNILCYRYQNYGWARKGEILIGSPDVLKNLTGYSGQPHPQSQNYYLLSFCPEG